MKRATLAPDPAPQRPYTLTRETLNAMFKFENHAAYRARQLAVSRRPMRPATIDGRRARLLRRRLEEARREAATLAPRAA